MTSYPGLAADRDAFVLTRRPPRARQDPWRAHGTFVEDERSPTGDRSRALTILLTGRECPWRCAMCDLWRDTTADDTPRGAIPAQIAQARAAATPPPAPVVKLYNAGSFFDPRAVPEADYDAIADALGGAERVIVECHPALVGRRVEQFQRALRRAGAAPALEVAVGLETAHPEALEQLNKHMTVVGFMSAATWLRDHGIDLRVFLLISPPFVPPADQDDWLCRSVEIAVASHATAISLIPLRAGNGTVEALVAEGAASLPSLDDIERSADLALDSGGAAATRIFVDLWDLARTSACAACLDARRARLLAINLSQRVRPRVACATCGSPHR